MKRSSEIVKVLGAIIVGLLLITSLPVVYAENSDSSTKEAASNTITVEKLENVGASNEVAVSIKEKADTLIEKYIDTRLNELKNKYKSLDGLSSADEAGIESQTTAEQLDKYIKDNFISWTKSRTQEVKEAIDAATTLDSIFGVLLSANIDARQVNTETAKAIISDLPSSEEKTSVENKINIIEQWLNAWAPRLFEGGLPKSFRDVPVDYKYTGEGGSAFLKEARDKQNNWEGHELGNLTNNIIGDASLVRKSVVAKGEPLTFKSKSVEALYKKWLEESHPFYLDDTIRKIIPELDEYAFEVEEQANINEIRFLDVKGVNSAIHGNTPESYSGNGIATTTGIIYEKGDVNKKIDKATIKVYENIAEGDGNEKGDLLGETVTDADGFFTLDIKARVDGTRTYLIVEASKEKYHENTTQTYINGIKPWLTIEHVTDSGELIEIEQIKGKFGDFYKNLGKEFKGYDRGAVTAGDAEGTLGVTEKKVTITYKKAVKSTNPTDTKLPSTGISDNHFGIFSVILGSVLLSKNTYSKKRKV